MTLYFTVINQRIERSDTEKPVAGSTGWLTAHFSFGAEWADLAKTAIFRAVSGVAYEAALDADGECEVPASAIATSGTVYVSVRGVSGATVIVPTSSCPVRIYP